MQINYRRGILRAGRVAYILPADTSEAQAIAYIYPFQPPGCRAAYHGATS
jgi:hypothetical protein